MTKTDDPPHAPCENERLAAANAAPRCGARARTRGHAACRNPAMANGRCRMHGGKSTGARTPQGLETCRTARLIHGGRSAKTVALRKRAMTICRELRRLVALADMYYPVRRAGTNGGGGAGPAQADCGVHPSKRPSQGTLGAYKSFGGIASLPHRKKPRSAETFPPSPTLPLEGGGRVDATASL